MKQITRRSFLTNSAAVATVAGFAGMARSRSCESAPLIEGTPNADKLGWRVGFSAYSFRTTTLFEALDKMAATGLHCTELFAWQKLSPSNPDAKPAPGLSKTLQKDLKRKAADSGVKLLGLYSGLDKPDSAKGVFAFAAEMGFRIRRR